MRRCLVEIPPNVLRNKQSILFPVGHLALKPFSPRHFCSTRVSKMKWSLQILGGGTHRSPPNNGNGTSVTSPNASSPSHGTADPFAPDLPSKLAPVLQSHSISEPALPVPVFILRFASKSYLFNAPESTQRALIARSLRLSTKLKDVFLTGQMEWTKWGGLPGFLLTLADSLVDQPTLQKLRVHGGDGIMHCLGSMRWFVYRGSVGVDVEEYPKLKAEAADNVDGESNAAECELFV